MAIMTHIRYMETCLPCVLVDISCISYTHCYLRLANLYCLDHKIYSIIPTWYILAYSTYYISLNLITINISITHGLQTWIQNFNIVQKSDSQFAFFRIGWYQWHDACLVPRHLVQVKHSFPPKVLLLDHKHMSSNWPQYLFICTFLVGMHKIWKVTHFNILTKCAMCKIEVGNDNF